MFIRLYLTRFFRADEIKMLIPEHFEQDAIVGTYVDTV